MFKRNLLPVWVGIILLSGIFLMGQDQPCWPECCQEFDITGDWEALDTGTCTDTTTPLYITRTNCHFHSIADEPDQTECEGPISGNTASVTCTNIHAETFDCVAEIDLTHTLITGECDRDGVPCTIELSKL